MQTRWTFSAFHQLPVLLELEFVPHSSSAGCSFLKPSHLCGMEAVIETNKNLPLVMSQDQDIFSTIC